MLRELSQRYAVMATSEAGRVRELLSGLTGAEATARLEQELTSMAAGIMQLPESAIDRQVSFTDLGLDSLMAVELKNRIRHDVGVDVPLVKLLSGPSIAELTLLVSVHRKMADLGGAVPQGDDVAEIEI
jgi:aryl carrier-like protein